MRFFLFLSIALVPLIAHAAEDHRSREKEMDDRNLYDTNREKVERQDKGFYNNDYHHDDYQRNYSNDYQRGYHDPYRGQQNNYYIPYNNGNTAPLYYDDMNSPYYYPQQ